MKWVKENNIELLEGGRNRKKMNKNIYFYEKIWVDISLIRDVQLLLKMQLVFDTEIKLITAISNFEGIKLWWFRGKETALDITMKHL